MNNIFSTLETALTTHPDKLAVIDGGLRFSYREIGHRVAGLAEFMRQREVPSMSRIAILDSNSHHFLESYFAVAAASAVLVPLNWRLSAGELARILEDAQASWLIANPKFYDLVMQVIGQSQVLKQIIWTSAAPGPTGSIETAEYEQALGDNPPAANAIEVEPNQLAHLYYTSGTTGTPKGVMLTHDNVRLHAQATVSELGLSSKDVWGHIAPMFHLADAWAVFAISSVGGTHVILRDFEPSDALAEIERSKITISNLIPTMLNLMQKHPDVRSFDLSSLRLVMSGGAPIAPHLVKGIMQTFACDYIQTYGMTETSPFLTLSLLDEQLEDLSAEEQLEYKSKTGRPFLSVELKVVDRLGNQVEPNGEQIGEILVRGETVTPGYWRRPEATREAFCDGWLCTGDLAVIDRYGYVDIVDRKKDVIISGGENVYSTEVENVIFSHPKVLEVAVFAVPDEKWGEAVKAAVVLKPEMQASQAELIDFCKRELASYKAPKSIDFMTHLPKTGSGKIFKKALREPYWKNEKKLP